MAVDFARLPELTSYLGIRGKSALLLGTDLDFALDLMKASLVLDELLVTRRNIDATPKAQKSVLRRRWRRLYENERVNDRDDVRIIASSGRQNADGLILLRAS